EPQWRDKTVGIIGCGNAGGLLLHRLSALGVTCHVYDPFLNAAECDALTDLETTLGADIICLHTPLTREGQHPTHHLINQEVLEQRIRPGALLINASRGGVIDNPALLAHLKGGAGLKVALDVWEGEPEINLDLLRQVNIATPHIAGYSLEGRLRGTQMVRDGMCRFLGLALDNTLSTLTVDLSVGEEGCGADPLIIATGQGLDQAILASYEVAEDDEQMRRALGDESGNSGGKTGILFDGLRKHYAQRREFSYYSVSGAGEPAYRSELELLGFNIQ
ncbi:MAG: DUF3410 domain-containing protein, partial [Gammaproteobacteria bacterium]|nr:DUF3410 domain-containing protein [Gammaproteobacteria bacterium]